MRPAMQAIFKPMDWLTTRVDDVKAWFKSDSDAAMLAEFKRINITRHQKDSFSCGIPDAFLGRVIYCVRGKRMFIGMMFDPWYAVACLSHLLFVCVFVCLVMFFLFYFVYCLCF